MTHLSCYSKAIEREVLFMSKRGRKMIVTLALAVQIILGILYGFSDIQVPAAVCFIIWCGCAMMINRVMEVSEAI